MKLTTDYSIGVDFVIPEAKILNLIISKAGQNNNLTNMKATIACLNDKGSSGKITGLKITDQIRISVCHLIRLSHIT